jgi:hypothetical protein
MATLTASLEQSQWTADRFRSGLIALIMLVMLMHTLNFEFLA